MPPTQQLKTLPLIRLSLFAGVVLFGAVAAFIHTQPSWTPAPTFPAAMVYVQAAMSAVAVIATFVFRARLASATSDGERGSLLILGWAIGEGPALLGAVIFFLTGTWQSYVIGLLAMVLVLLLLPIKQRG